MPANEFRALIAAVTLIAICAFSTPAAGQTSSTVAGTITDAEGHMIFRVPVILISEAGADGRRLSPARSTPATAGSGAATGAQAMRSVQMQLRFIF